MSKRNHSLIYFHKSWTSLHLSFDFFTPQIGVLHRLLQGFNSLRSFKFSMIDFNPSLTFSGHCFRCGNKQGSLRLIMTGTAFCVQHTIFPSAHTSGFTFARLMGEKVQTPYSWKRKPGPCPVYPSPDRVSETLAGSETREETAESPSSSLKDDK